MVPPPFFSLKIIQKNPEISVQNPQTQLEHPVRICWTKTIIHSESAKNTKNIPPKNPNRTGTPGLALQVALNPLCDLAGYALAPASVIAPVTGMDIAGATQRTQRVEPGGRWEIRGTFGWEIGSFLVKNGHNLGFSHIFFVFSGKN